MKEAITPDSFVLDIGSGSGVWAIMAAKLGARHVLAVEQEELLIGLIRTLARDNGVADRVQVVNARSHALQVDTLFDVVISETIGHLVFDEEIVSIMIDARKRFLKPGGLIIPQSVALLAAPARFEPNPTLPSGIAADFEYFESLLLNVPVGLMDQKRLQILGPPKELVRVDLNTVATSPELENLEATWELDSLEGINSFAVWAVADLSPHVSINTTQTSSWSTTVYRSKPFSIDRGRLQFKLALTSETNYWTISETSGENEVANSYSPAFAGTQLLAQSKMNPDVFSQMRNFGLFESGTKTAVP